MTSIISFIRHNIYLQTPCKSNKSIRLIPKQSDKPRSIPMSDKINILSELWTTKQAADYLGTTVKSLTTQRYLGRLKDLKHYRIGHKVMYKKVDLDNWIEAHAENA